MGVGPLRAHVTLGPSMPMHAHAEETKSMACFEKFVRQILALFIFK